MFTESVTLVGSVAATTTSRPNMHIEARCCDAVRASAVVPSLTGTILYVSQGGRACLLLPIIALGQATTWSSILNPEDIEVTEADEVHEE